MKKQIIFSGIATALITPFNENGIDTQKFEMQLRRQLDAGIDALVVCGTTGEAPTLSDKEHIELIERAVKYVGGEVPIIAGTGSNCTEHAVLMSKAARDVGADALLVVTPYYNKANAAGLVKSYTAIAEAAQLPMILYNVPSRTGMEIPTEAYENLADNEYIVASKEASSSISRFGTLVSRFEEKINFYCGNDEMTLPCLSLGGKGCISVLSNLLPEKTRELYTLWCTGDADGARKLQLALLPLIGALFSDVNPIPIKTVMSHYRLDSGLLRLPLCEMNEEKKIKLIEEAKKFY